MGRSSWGTTYGLPYSAAMSHRGAVHGETAICVNKLPYLVNGGNYSPPSFCKLTQHLHAAECYLTVQATGRLIAAKD